MRERAINWHVSRRRGETLEIGSLFEGRRREREREEERYVCIKDTSSTPFCLARVISLLEAKWGKLKAPYRRPRCSAGCPVAGLEVENRVDGAPFNAFVCPINRCTRLSRDLPSRDCLYSWKSRCTFQRCFKEEIERKRESNFRRRRGEICEIYSYTENVAGGVREGKIGYLKTVAIFNCSQEEERGGGG